MGHKQQRVMKILQQGVFTVSQINHNFFSFPYAAHKGAGLCPDITAAELFVLGNKEFLRCLPVHETLSH